MGAPFPSTYKQVVENMVKIKEMADNYVQPLIDTIFSPTAASDGSTDVKYDPTNSKLEVIGTTILTDNPNVQSGPSEYFRNITWETKASSVMGLSGLPNIGDYVVIMTVSVPGTAVWQVAYSDDRMATYFRKANDDLATWTDWESVGRKQFIQSDVQPAANVQGVGDYWVKPVEGGHQLYRKSGESSYTQIFPQTNDNMVLVQNSSKSLNTKLDEIDDAIDQAGGDLSAHNTDPTAHANLYIHAGQKSGTTLGANATAEGVNNTASGPVSHAEGQSTVASGTNSHAEGSYTVASAIDSHAEGSNTTSDGGYSHAEGSGTIASGPGSHAEGLDTEASSTAAHAEGVGTIAQRKSQHVFGEYNKPDTTGSMTVRGTYVEIVGNGSYSNSRSNARTLDWNGNETLAGKLTLGSGNATAGAPVNDADAATKKYVDDTIESSGGTVIVDYDSDAEEAFTIVNSAYQLGKAVYVRYKSYSSSSSYTPYYLALVDGPATESLDATTYTFRAIHGGSEYVVTLTNSGQSYEWSNSINDFLKTSGGTMTGELSMGDHNITDLATPSRDNDAATKKYVDDTIGNMITAIFGAGSTPPDDTRLLWIDTDSDAGGLKYYDGSSWRHVPVAYTSVDSISGLSGMNTTGASALTAILSYGTNPPDDTRLLWIDTSGYTGGLKFYNGTAWVHIPTAYN